MKKQIGLRTIKTGIAVALAVVVSNLLSLEYPFFVCMTAIISMDRTVLLSLQMGCNRVVGTLIGACLGVIFNYIGAGNPILCGVGIIVLITILNKLKLNGAIGIGGIVFSAIMVHIGDNSPILYGFHRTFDSLIGASISLIINMLILPYYNVNELTKKVDKLEGLVKVRANDALLKQTIEDIDLELELHVQELVRPNKKQELFELCAKIDLLKSIVKEIELMNDAKDDEYVKKYYEDRLEAAIERYYHFITS